MSGEQYYTLEHVSAVTGIAVARLRQMRAASMVDWHSKGYTVEEILKITGPRQLVEPWKMLQCRSQKARDLYERLGGTLPSGTKGGGQ